MSRRRRRIVECIPSISWMQLSSSLKKLELVHSCAEHKNNVKVKHLLISDCGRTAFHLKPIIFFQAARPSSGSFKHYLGKHNRTSGISFCSTLSPHPLPCQLAVNTAGAFSLFSAKYIPAPNNPRWIGRARLPKRIESDDLGNTQRDQTLSWAWTPSHTIAKSCTLSE